MNGAPVRPASRRAISVLPTPVGPIMRMFFGATSWRIASGSRCLRQRLRIATATARLASFCPTMYLSSSVTICLGVRCCIWRHCMFGLTNRLHFHVAVGIDADFAGDFEGGFYYFFSGQLGMFEERLGRGLGVGAA